MKIGIAGARGSLPTPSGKTLFGKVENTEFGGNTTCIYVQGDDGSEHILDAGTGIRDLGVSLAREGGFNGKGKQLQLYLSHTHWDHIQGLPFFVPAYILGNNIEIFGEAKVKNVKEGTKVSLEDNLRGQQDFRNFPAPLEVMKGLTRFNDFTAGTRVYQSETLTVDTFGQNHPGGSVGYRFTEKKKGGANKVFVFSTDFEPKEADAIQMVAHWEGADLVLADAQYEPKGSLIKENTFMEGWGHSDYRTNLAMATQAEVKKLVLTHHEPKMGDAYHRALELRAATEAEKIAEMIPGKERVKVELAREGRWYTL
ncbi:MBL fold metallo-hydrolase [Candidatus Woesearchaeota archaeon]|nr:MBL fold metallo-hydrolase [Candidatus Woesearchaeota archaeon]